MEFLWANKETNRTGKMNVQIVYKTPWTFKPPIYKIQIQAYYQTIYVQNMNMLKQNW